MRQEKGMSDAEKQIESIQSACLREKSTECVCPKCGTHHRVKLLWTGRGLPRKFCPVCKHYATAIHDAEPFVVSSVAGAWSSSA